MILSNVSSLSNSFNLFSGFGVDYLLNSISIRYGILNAEILCLSKYWVVTIDIYRLNLIYKLNGLSIPYGLFNAEYWIVTVTVFRFFSVISLSSSSSSLSWLQRVPRLCLVPIVHCSWQVLQTACSIHTELLSQHWCVHV